MTSLKICKLSDVPDGGARGFRPGGIALIVLRRNGKLYAFQNSCPHTGVNLDWVTDQFLDVSGRFIQCSTHGALFRITDGFCVSGPCAGCSLSAVPVEIRAGDVNLVAGEAGSEPAGD